MSDLYRNSKNERFLHWTHLVSTALLFITGLTWYWPWLARLIGGYQVTMVVHRVAATVFIIIPVVMIIINWKGFIHFMKELLHWTGNDTKWMMTFPLYVLNNDKTKMPLTKGKHNSGQKFNGSMTIGLCVALAVSGIIWIFFPNISFGNMDVLGLSHRIAALTLFFMLGGHVFLGSGAFKPYRGMARTMFGDGKVPEKLAKKIWPAWVDEVKGETSPKAEE